MYILVAWFQSLCYENIGYIWFQSLCYEILIKKSSDYIVNLHTDKKKLYKFWNLENFHDNTRRANELASVSRFSSIKEL